MKETILVIDDQQTILDSIEMILEYAGYQLFLSNNAAEGLKILDKETIDLVLLDIRMEGMDGLTCLSKIKEKYAELPVIMISGVANVQMAINATKQGAFDLLEKPLDKDRMILTIQNALKFSSLRKENEQIKKSLKKDYRIIGRSPRMKQIFEIIAQVAPTDARVLITGENGTGKELVARSIHEESKRASKPFVELNCAAIPKELLESELFGHEKGSFTGAHQRQIGKFEQAHAGTIFFDEIGDMDFNAQAKTLRALEEGVINRVGGTQNIKVDTRVIAATNKDLDNEIAQNNFREDLFYRLNVVPINLPPLRERKEDIPELAVYFVNEFCQRESIELKSIAKEALDFLMNQVWYGNIRELRNVIERSVILCKNQEIQKKDLMITARNEKGSDVWSQLRSVNDFGVFKELCEKKYLQYHLEKNDWQISRTAKEIKIQRSNLYLKLERYFPEYFNKTS